MNERLDPRHGLANNGSALMPPVYIIETPDPDGCRWQQALEILLGAGVTQDSGGDED